MIQIPLGMQEAAQLICSAKEEWLFRKWNSLYQTCPRAAITPSIEKLQIYSERCRDYLIYLTRSERIINACLLAAYNPSFQETPAHLMNWATSLASVQMGCLDPMALTSALLLKAQAQGYAIVRVWVESPDKKAGHNFLLSGDLQEINRTYILHKDVNTLIKQLQSGVILDPHTSDDPLLVTQFDTSQLAAYVQLKGTMTVTNIEYYPWTQHAPVEYQGILALANKVRLIAAQTLDTPYNTTPAIDYLTFLTEKSLELFPISLNPQDSSIFTETISETAQP